MRMTIRPLLLLLLLLLPLSVPVSARAQGAVVGALAPDFALKNMQGEEVRLSQLRGKVVIVNFWATWCPPCRREMPSMQALHDDLASDGLVILAINTEKEGRESVASFLQQAPYSFPILLDDRATVQEAYNVFQFPESFIVDANGVIVQKLIGAVNWTGPRLYPLLRFLVKG